MAKLAQTASKYIIYAKFTADGVVEKPDVIGAVFGQTEGLLGAGMDLRELQKTGRIGRIEVDVKSTAGKTTGRIEIPSSLDASETSLIAATLETIERIGPCETKIEIEKVDDVRTSKRKFLMDRAKTILTQLEEGMPESQEITEQIKEAVRSSEVAEYQGLPAGPDVATAEEVIICEGRADVLRLLKSGIKNAVAVEGTSIPAAVVSLSKERSCTAFLDGDRGGDLILKEMLQRGVELEFVARAPTGKEVEELTKKEIYKALRERILVQDAERALNGIPPKTAESMREIEEPKERVSMRVRAEEERPSRAATSMEAGQRMKFKEILDGLTGTRAAYLLDDSMAVLGKIPTKELYNAMREVAGARTIIFDGTVDQKLVNFAKNNSVKNIVGMKIERGVKAPRTMTVLAAKDL